MICQLVGERRIKITVNVDKPIVGRTEDIVDEFVENAMDRIEKDLQAKLRARFPLFNMKVESRW